MATARQQDLRPGDRSGRRCRVCSGTTLQVMPFRYAFKDRFLVGVRCLGCAVTFLDPLPADEEIAELYGEEYFTVCSETCGAHGPAAYMEMAGSSSADRVRGARRLDRLFREQLSTRGRLLEVGCGPGLLLAELRSLGWGVQGLEISRFAVRHATERLGLDVVHGSVEPANFPEGSFDAVFMGDVLEHLPRPVSSLRAVFSWLKPGGVLIVAIPSTLNLLSAQLGMALYRVRGKFKTLRIPPYHLFEHTPRSIRNTLVTAGFDVVSVYQSTVPLGKMGLRGSRIENLGKVALQVVASLTCRLFNRGGDRLLVVSTRKER